MKKKKRLFIVLLTLGILLLIPVSFAITDKIRYDNGEERYLQEILDLLVKL